MEGRAVEGRGGAVGGGAVEGRGSWREGQLRGGGGEKRQLRAGESCGEGVKS